MAFKYSKRSSLDYCRIVMLDRLASLLTIIKGFVATGELHNPIKEHFEPPERDLNDDCQNSRSVTSSVVLYYILGGPDVLDEVFARGGNFLGGSSVQS